MNIRNWPFDRIMQLPDCAFGQRWLIGLFPSASAQGTYYDISEMGLGDRCVIWRLSTYGSGSAEAIWRVSLALGDHDPANDAEFAAFEQLFRGLGKAADGRWELEGAYTGFFVFLPMRVLVAAQGRRLVARFELTTGLAIIPAVIIEVSGIPTEVPDWMLSGSARSL